MRLPAWVCRVRWDGPWTARRSLASLEADALAAPLDVPAPWNASHPEPWDHVTLPRSLP